MRSSKITYVGVSAASYPWIPVDHHIENANISFALTESGPGNVTGKIQGTLDNLSTEASATAFDIVSGAVASAAAGVAYWTSLTNTPLAAVRLVVAVSASANATFTLMQSGN